MIAPCGCRVNKHNEITAPCYLHYVESVKREERTVREQEAANDAKREAQRC